MNKKILVIGCPGSGKSYLAKSLSQKTNIPCFHIDNLYWNIDKTHINRDDLIDKYQDILSKDEFILDGNYLNTLEYRANFSDTIIFLDFSLDDCIKGIKERNNAHRDDIPWVQNEIDGEELIAWIREFSTRDRPVILDILKRYKGTIISLKNKEEVNEFIKRGID